jgi:hypothetical protein
VLAAFYFIFFFYIEKSALNSNKKYFYIYIFLNGLICSIAFLVKPTLGILLFSFLQARMLLYALEKKYRKFIITILISNISFWLFQIGLHLEFPYYSFLRVLHDGNEFQKNAVLHNGSYIFKKLLSTLQWSFFLFIAGYILGIKSSSNLKNKLWFNLLKYISFATIVLFFLYKHSSSNRFGVAEYSLTFSALVVLGYLFYGFKFRSLSKTEILLCLLLFFLPIFCQFGSNVYYFRICQYYSFFWWLLALIIYQKNETKYVFKSPICILLSMFILYNIYINHIKWKMDSNDILKEFVQFNYSTKMPILIHNDQFNYFVSLGNKLNKYTNSTNKKYVIGMYEFPGDILLSGAKIFYNPLYWTKNNVVYYSKSISREASEYNEIYPLVLTKNYTEAQNDLSSQYGSVLLDSLSHWQGGNIYILQTTGVKK